MVLVLKNTDKYECLLMAKYSVQEIDFSTSMDGINVRPHMAPYQNGKDWAHIDQTIPNNPFLCVQGQVILSDTSACFRASP